MDASALAVETHGLTKRFGRRTAVDAVDLAVPCGSVFGFLGPNGSGKTTTIRMLLGLITASSGDAAVLGRRMPDEQGAVLPRVGALVEGPGFAPYLSGAQNLARLDAADARADGRSRRRRIADALDRVGLAAAADRKVKAYSLGMKQRLGLANALLRPRDLLVLDEPTNGLDPQGTREVRSLVRALASDGTTVFVSSHLLAEIEQICTHAGIMRAGRLVAQGSLEALRGGGTVATVTTPDVAAAHEVLVRFGGTPQQAPSGTAAVAALPDGVAPEALVDALVTAAVRVRGFTVAGASLEERFVELTGEGFDVES
ncbi:ATP-binding cassette domain-containing protein [Amnibacterium sp. CER49]|uniref:ABC transporter ATP-binding protein n=1 Tax=Amnibacterium sp. CER49 TaxID=3039161 RepID=UPI00244B397E|nr:ATP-binding cassette domain-containing protein [Amnibacterium sp. CER49]MDH2444772.1 ATP-binding cassette domain-containing protein [Amnibacterium sp. CER49]